MDESTILELYKTCFPRVARYVLRSGGSPEAAEEAFQTALYGLLEQVEKGNLIENLGGYLYISAVHAFTRERTRFKRFESTEVFQSDWSDDPALEHGSAAAEIQTFAIATSRGNAAREPVEPSPGPDHQTHQNMLISAAEKCIRLLARGEQQILELSFNPDTDLDDSQIAAILGIERESVKVKRSRAMSTLRKIMAQQGYL